MKHNLHSVLFKRLTLVIFLFASAALPALTLSEASEEFYRLYIIADPHLEDESHELYSERVNALAHFVNAVNEDENRDLAFNLGDTAQARSDRGIIDTIQQWNRIEPTDYLKETGKTDYPWYTLGNHETFILNRFDFTDKFSQTEHEIGGSAWNGEFIYAKHDCKLHFVIMDCMFDDNNERATSNPRLHDRTVSWMQNILRTTECSMIILIAHAMPHYFEKHGEYYWGDEKQAKEISDTVRKSLKENKDLDKVVWFAGHWHGAPFGEHIKYTNLGDHLPGYRIPPAQDGNKRHGEKGVFSIVDISMQGEIFIDSVLTPPEME